MGCAGNPDVITPNLDKMAEEGTMFNHAYANSPVCTPSRGSLLTGLYPLSHGAVANDISISDNAVGIGEILKNAGYKTGYIGKWHLDSIPRDKFTPPGQKRLGFNYWAAWNCAHSYFNGCYYENDNEKPKKIIGYEPIGQTDLAIDFIKNSNEQPFCLYLSWGPPHDPYLTVPENYKQMYDSRKLKWRANVNFDSETSRQILWRNDKQADANEILACYYAAITALDDQMGRIMNTLKDEGLSDNTIVVFTSDHGDMLWSHGMMKKQQPWEESINVPFIIKWPGNIPAGEKRDQLLSVVDMAPSFLGLLEIEGTEKMQGGDFSPIMKGCKSKGSDSVYIMDIVSVLDESGRQGIKEWRGIRTKRYTYARLQDGEGWVLYDNVEDPYQMNNLINNEKYSKIKQECEERLQKWMQYTNDEFLEGKEHLKKLNLADEWNKRETFMHPKNPDLIVNK